MALPVECGSLPEFRWYHGLSSALSFQKLTADFCFYAAGWRLILLTMREGVGLEMALRWCEARGLHFDAVNECPDFPRSRKVFAHVSVDDRAVGCPTRRFRGKDVVDWEGVMGQLRGR